MQQFISENNLKEKGFDNLPGGVFIYRADDSQKILYANEKTLKLFDCENLDEFIELTGGSFKGIVFNPDLSYIESDIYNQVSSEDYNFHHLNYRIRTKSGKIRYIEDFGQLVHDPVWGALVYAFIIDSNIKFLTYDIDKLTGLPGNRRFVEYASRILEFNRKTANNTNFLILFINISRFKTYNVKHGFEKGDELLRATTAIIKQEFPNHFVSRFSDDHFTVMTEEDNVIEKIKRINSRVYDLKEGSKIGVNVGIYRIKPEDTDVSVCCDLAKIACDSIRNDMDSFYRFYEVSLSRSIEIYDYVIENINTAIENGYIKVYYQPVIRTFSGALCGMEALARWIDPVKGFLSPGVFIEPLENSKQIYKLDGYIINEVCRNYRERTDKGESTVPVSFNLSRLDFTTCDIFDIVESAIKKYRVPRSAVNIEITESVFAKNAAAINKEVERFREAGYLVWMDDFGSGYSSLNVLKDYSFDELKIDMEFLSSFTQKSKDIIRSTIDMAQTLGLQHVAEGVETEEQFEFLKSIGCGKVQGYYFGKPLPYDECIGLCMQKGYEPETPDIKAYYDRLGEVNLITDMPLAIFEYDREKIRLIHINKPYKRDILFSEDSSLELVEEFLNSERSPVALKFKDFLQEVIESGGHKKFTYPDRGKLICIEAEIVSSHLNRYMVKSTVENISFYPKKTPQEELSSILRNVYRLYDEVRLVDLKEDSIERIITVFGKEEEQRKLPKIFNIDRALKIYTSQNIFSEDVEKVERFYDFGVLINKFKTERRDAVTGYFRTRNNDGEFRLAAHTVLSLPSTDVNKFILFIKFIEYEKIAMLKEIIKG